MTHRIQHTPGPWVVGGSLISNGKETISLILRRPAVYGGKTYNTRDTDSQAPAKGETCEANARLIAAAPELLSVAQALVEARKCIGWGEGECDVWLGTLWHAAQDAITQAQGA